MRFATNEVLMCVDVISVAVANLFKGVNVCLADEGGEVVVFVVEREDFFGESGNISNYEGIVGGGPTHNVGEVLVLLYENVTSSICSSLTMKRGVYGDLSFLLRLLII